MDIRILSLQLVALYGEIWMFSLAGGRISLGMDFVIKGSGHFQLPYLCFVVLSGDVTSQLPGPTTIPAACFCASLS